MDLVVGVGVGVGVRTGVGNGSDVDVGTNVFWPNLSPPHRRDVSVNLPSPRKSLPPSIEANLGECSNTYQLRTKNESGGDAV